MLQQAPSALGSLLLRDLTLSTAHLGLLSSVIVGGMALTTFLMGILIDRFGERRVMATAAAAVALFVFTASLARSYTMLLALFLFAGCAAAASTPGGSKAIVSWFPLERRGLATGIRQTGIPIGGILAAIILLPIAQSLGWRVALAAGTLGTLIVAIVFIIFYREPRMIVAQPKPEKCSSMIASENPSVTQLRSLLNNRTFLAATGYSFVLVGAQWAATAYLVLAMSRQAGISLVAAGAILAIMQAGGVAGRVGWGAISDVSGRRPVMILLGFLGIASCLAMAFVSNETPLVVLAILAAMLGLSVLSWQGLYVAVVTEVAGAASAATVVGAGLTITYAGSLILPPLFGMVVDITGSYAIFWLVLMGWVAASPALGALVQDEE